MKILRCIFCIGFLLSSILHAQIPHIRLGVEGQISLGKLDEMQSALSVADAKQKADLLIRLGVEKEIANVTTDELLPEEKILLHSVRTPLQASYAVAFLPGFRGCFLYLMQGSDADVQKHPWHVIDRQNLDCWHGDSTLEFLSLRQKETDDIVAHHVNLGHGSGMVEDQTQIYSILNSKLVQTMATQDYLSEVTWGTDITTERQSTFLLFPDRSLEESRTTSIKDVFKKVERRYWHWSEARQKFVSSPFRTVIPPTL
jgi:hypothetical protein